MDLLPNIDSNPFLIACTNHIIFICNKITSSNDFFAIFSLIMGRQTNINGLEQEYNWKLKKKHVNIHTYAYLLKSIKCTADDKWKKKMLNDVYNFRSVLC